MQFGMAAMRPVAWAKRGRGATVLPWASTGDAPSIQPSIPMTSCIPDHPTTRGGTAACAAAYAVTLFIALAATACATVNAPEASSTLPRFEELRVQSDGTRSWHDAAARRVKTVHIDPQAIVFGADVRIDETQRQALRTSLSQALTAQFGAAGLRVAKSHGESDGAMAVRATVTQVALANPVLNTVTTVLLFAPVSRGSLSVEIEGLGGVNQQRLAALAFSGKAGIENLSSAFSGMGHAKLQGDIAASKFVALVTGVSSQPAAPAPTQGEVQP
jgi:hypothetical protein